MQLGSGGSALIIAAMSFWVTYVETMVSFHAKLLSPHCLPDLK